MISLSCLSACVAVLPFQVEQGLTLEEKIGQLLMVHFNGREANDDARTLIQTVHVGGVIYYNFANGLDSPEQVRTLSCGLQQLASTSRAGIPLLIAADQEGGLVARLDHGFTVFPGNRAIGATQDPELAEKEALAIGEELTAVGVNMNLAPVADINSNPANPIMSIRSFGSSAKLVTAFVEKSLAGYRQAGVLTSVKHFPGHGNASVDSHEDLPVVNQPIEELWQNELVPYSLLCNQTDTIMTAHVMVPAIDPKNCATLSKPILSLLRDNLHFQGVIISDSLVMEGVLKNCGGSVEEAAIRAFDAGCDILLLGGKQLQGMKCGFELNVKDIQQIHQALVEAVHTGRIAKERLDQSVSRIIQMKNQCKRRLVDSVNWDEHQKLAQTIAKRSIRVKQNQAIDSISKSRIAFFAPEIAHHSIAQTSLTTLGNHTVSFYFQSLNPSADEAAAAEKLANTADILVFCSYNAWKNASQDDLLKHLSQMKPTILIALRDENDAILHSDLPIVIATFSPTAPSIQAVKEYLELHL